MLDDRKSQVIQALVEEYIRSGEPVSSQAILDRSGLDVSSATIRNELAKLESYGFVAQPHTSAGRVPTEQGYRYYVDHCSPIRLRAATRARIEGFFSEVHHELARLLKDTSGLLSDITHFPAVVIGPGLGGDAIHSVNIIRIGGPTVLVVTVAETGRVVQQMVTLDFEPSDRQLDESERLISAVYCGHALQDVHDDERVAATDLPDVVRRIVQPVHRQLQHSDPETRPVFVGGTSQLAELWNDLAIVHRVLGFMDSDDSLRQLLEESGEGTSVRIGAEVEDDAEIAVVTSTFDAGTGGTGRVGVIGPMRMDYRRTIRVVEEIGDGLEESIVGER